jgi:carboxymethylenebutenolidase
MPTYPEVAEKATVVMVIHEIIGLTDWVGEVADQLTEAGKRYEPVLYEGEGHGFTRAGEAPDASEAKSKGRAAAWERWRKLLAGL